jgi:hypothetical protein
VLGLSGCSTKGVGVAPTPLTFSLFTWGAVVANSPPHAQRLPCLFRRS